jgi:hypothetical protein
VNKKEDEQFRRRVKRWTKQDRKWLKRYLADKDAKAHADSKNRQKDIAALLDELKKSGPHILELAKEDDAVAKLVELVNLQKDEITYLTDYFGKPLLRIWKHTPNASKEAEVRELREFAADLYAKNRPKPTPKQRKEQERRAWRFYLPDGKGLIEWEFGGAAQAQLEKTAVFAHIIDYEPRCLDVIFIGGRVTMDGRSRVETNALSGDQVKREPGLQELFGLDSNRFPKALPPVRQGRETFYNYRAVTMIMHSLLSDDTPKRKKEARGGSRPRLWLSDPTVRASVLLGIEARVNKVGSDAKIKAEFMKVIRCYSPDSAK